MADYSDLMSLLEGQGRFSAISPFRLDNKALASVIGTAGHVQSAAIDASTRIPQEMIRGATQLRATGMRDKGETFRQRLVNQANEMLEEMRQSGATFRTQLHESGETGRTGMREAGATERTKLVDAGQNWRHMKERLHNKEMLDAEIIARDRLRKIARPGAFDPNLVDELDIGPTPLPASPQQNPGLGYFDIFDPHADY